MKFNLKYAGQIAYASNGAFWSMWISRGVSLCLCNRLDFKVNQLGLMNKYRSIADFKMRMKKLAALAFIPLVCKFTKS